MRKRKKGVREYRVRYKYRNKSGAVSLMESDGMNGTDIRLCVEQWRSGRVRGHIIKES